VIGNTTFWENLISDLSNKCENSGISCKVAFAELVEPSLVKKYLFEYQILTKSGRVVIHYKARFPYKLGKSFSTKRPELATNFGDMDKYFTGGKDIVRHNAEILN
jgi:hypothetical protein